MSSRVRSAALAAWVFLGMATYLVLPAHVFWIFQYTLPEETATTIALPEETATTIEVGDLNQLMEKGNRFVLLDVRQPSEFNQGHISGAVLMPLGSLPSDYNQIPKDAQLVVYCRSGRRSAQAVSFLREHGYTKAVSLSGGYLAWSGAQ